VELENFLMLDLQERSALSFLQNAYQINNSMPFAEYPEYLGVFERDLVRRSPFLVYGFISQVKNLAKLVTVPGEAIERIQSTRNRIAN
jgi:hypothetical protein